MLSIIGVGLEPEDLSIKALKLIKEADVVYLEKYTSILMNEKEIEKIIEREVLPAYREDMEDINDPKILRESLSAHVVLLVVGTPFFATTHTELVIRAKELNVKTNILHNSSIQSVVGCCGFNSYGFGRTVSIPFFFKEWRPYDFLLNILNNFENGLHTLCLLDIKINEPTLDTLLGKEEKRYTRFMTTKESISQIEEALAHYKNNVLNEVKILSIERFGLPTETYTYGTLNELKEKEFGPPLHSLIIPSQKGNQMERENIERYFRESRK